MTLLFSIVDWNLWFEMYEFIFKKKFYILKNKIVVNRFLFRLAISYHYFSNLSPIQYTFLGG